MNLYILSLYYIEQLYLVYQSSGEDSFSLAASAGDVYPTAVEMA